MLSIYHFTILSWGCNGTTGRYSSLHFTVSAWDVSFEKAVHEPTVLSSSIQTLASFSSKILFPTALSSPQAIFLSVERLSNSRLANSSLRFGIIGGDAPFLWILDSPKSLSSSSSKISVLNHLKCQ